MHRAIHTRAAAILAASVALLAGCTVVPASTARQACSLLQTASDEADMAPAWYLQAGALLEQCGHQDARTDADYKACQASRRAGFDRDCEVLPVLGGEP